MDSVITPKLLAKFDAEYTESKYCCGRFFNPKEDRYCAVGWLGAVTYSGKFNDEGYADWCTQIANRLDSLLTLHLPQRVGILDTNDTLGYDAVKALMRDLAKEIS